jgi:hypothetical protein
MAELIWSERAILDMENIYDRFETERDTSHISICSQADKRMSKTFSGLFIKAYTKPHHKTSARGSECGMLPVHENMVIYHSKRNLSSYQRLQATSWKTLDSRLRTSGMTD